jgi:hypothetical protein
MSRPRFFAPASTTVETQWLDEPLLGFHDGGTHDDPKTGITLYGPVGLSNGTHRSQVHVGLIGTESGVRGARELLEASTAGVAGDESITPFPGCAPEVGYRCTLEFSDKTTQTLTLNELRDVVETKKSRDRFEGALALLDDKFRVLTSRDAPLDYVMVVIPDDLFRRARATDYRDGGPVHRDLRRAFKSHAMVRERPTQLIRESTIVRPDTARSLDHPATVAWNLFTGLYFKAGCTPWAPTGLARGSCFIGISFYRPLGDAGHMRAAVAQAFDELGNGWVLRGDEFPWNEARDGRQPHLPADLAVDLIHRSVALYRDELGTVPSRVVIHKQSQFSTEERSAFADAIGDALTKSASFDLVGLRRTSDVRLVREGKYPPLRGTLAKIEDRSFLYSTGYLPYLGRYPHGHVPAPIEIIDHHGDSDPRRIFEEVLALTKLNWNSAGYAETMPITLRFSGLVGDVLREVPADRKPNPRYAFYM